MSHEPVRGELTPATVETDRLVLQPLERDAAGRIIIGDLGGWQAGEGWPHADTIDGLDFAARGAGVAWLVLRDGVVIGDCGTIGRGDSTGTVEVGYGLAAPYRGHGYGGEMVRGLSGWLIAQPGIHRVVAETADDNIPSRRALRSAGFHEINGRFELAVARSRAGLAAGRGEGDQPVPPGRPEVPAAAAAHPH